MIVVGIYTGDISIPVEPFTTPQLQFLLIFECSAAELPKNLRFEVVLPKQEMIGWNFPLPENIPIPEGRSKFTIRQPFAILNAVLAPGQIKAKVIYDEKEIDLGGPWITLIRAPDATTDKAA